MQYNSIPENQQANMLAALWSMLRVEDLQIVVDRPQ